MKTIDTPRRFKSRARSKKYFFSSGVKVAVGSSKMMILRVVQYRARDFDHLLLGRPKRRDGSGRCDIEVQRLQELLRRDVNAAQTIVKMLRPRKRFCATVMVGTRLFS